ncbi:MAG: glycosyltransferase family 2 protein [Chloroflexota bacterium]
MTITAAIIARDEERHLGRCLDGLSWADARLVVLDDRTVDRSAEVARERGTAVESRAFTTFPAQRNAALDLVKTDWVLFVDADERVTPALAEEIRAVIARAADDAPVGYWIPRRNFMWGGWIRHGGWSPDDQLRLLKVACARYDEERDVHELVNLAGESSRLREALLHYNYEDVQQFITKQRSYSTLEAERLSRAGKAARPQNFALQPIREFRRRYVELEGYRDGLRGLTLATLTAWSIAVTYAKLARMRANGRQ